MSKRRRPELRYGRTRDYGDGKEKDEHPEWRQSNKSGLWLPGGVPDGGRRPPVGFARALADGGYDGASGAEL